MPTNKELKRIVDDNNQQSFDFTKVLQNPNESSNSKYSCWIENSAIYSCTPLVKNSSSIEDYPPMKIPFSVENISLTISPAIVEDAGKNSLSYLQFTDEVLISILINLLCKNNVTLYEEDGKINYTLVTTYTEIKQEYKKIGKAKRNEEIATSLQRLRSTTFQLKALDVNLSYETSLIGWFKLYDPETAPKDCRLIIKFNEIVEGLIEGRIKTKQYNHQLTYTGHNQLAVWIKKEVLIHATNISETTPFKIKVENLYFYSNQFNLKENKAKKQKLKRALSELVEADADLQIIRKIITPAFKTDIAKDIMTIFTEDGFNEQSIAKNFILSSDKEVCEKLNDYRVELNKKNQNKLFTFAKFEKHGKEEYLYLYPTKLLVKEMMRSNAADKLENADKKIHPWS